MVKRVIYYYYTFRRSWSVFSNPAPNIFDSVFFIGSVCFFKIPIPVQGFVELGRFVDYSLFDSLLGSASYFSFVISCKELGLLS
jgi:uncharacterized membrane protein